MRESRDVDVDTGVVCVPTYLRSFPRSVNPGCIKWDWGESGSSECACNHMELTTDTEQLATGSETCYLYRP
eukprot:787462-Pleurochrysis_carterae.AAC.4